MSLSVPFKVKAKYGWSGQTKGDLGFLEGDIMEVTRVAGDWFYGRLIRNSKSAGYFPNNFVTLLEERVNDSRIRTPTEASSGSRTPKKVSLPPVPSRSNYKTRGIPMARNVDQPAQFSRSRRHNLEKIHYNSTPDLPTVSKKTQSTGLGIYGAESRDHYNSSRYLVRNDNSVSSQGSRPSLPPLPQIDTRKTRKVPTKSHSSNDLMMGNSRDNMYSKESFTDNSLRMRRNSMEDISEYSSGLFSSSHYLDNSVTSSENSFAIMSDFSATSAGSFARHKNAPSFADSLEKSQNMSPVMENVKEKVPFSVKTGNSLEEGKSIKASGFWKKLISKGNTTVNIKGTTSSSLDLPRLPDLQNLNISDDHEEARDWLNINSHLNRSKTLTKYEKHPRYMRALEQDRNLILHPQDAIYNGLNTNEVRYGSRPGQVDLELADLNVEYLDHMTWKRCLKNDDLELETWAKVTFGPRYATVVQKLRGVFVFCSEMFDLIDDKGKSDFSSEPQNLKQILRQNFCTPYELTWLFKKIVNSLGIECEIIIGFLKTPGSKICEFKFNHCWLSVLVNNEWRFIDVILGNTTNPIHEFLNNKRITKAENSYFLVEPLKFIYTHVPPREFEQHIVPSLDQLSVLYLPLVFPSFFKNDLKIYKYSTALAFLEDSEVYECSLEIPNDIEVFASVVVAVDDPTLSRVYGNMELALVQIRKHKSNSARRVAIVKAVLPPGVQEGSLYIHSGIRGKQEGVLNVHPLSMIVQLYHKGNSMKYEFVRRISSKDVQDIEIYINQPQNYYLFANNEYTFDILEAPFDGIASDGAVSMPNTKSPIYIESPSGKLYDLRKDNPNIAHGNWQRSIKIKEPGFWKCLAKTDAGLGLSEVAKWLCV